MQTATIASKEGAAILLDLVGLTESNTRFYGLIHQTIYGLWRHEPGSAYHSLVASELGGAAGEVLVQTQPSVDLPLPHIPDPTVVRAAFALHDIEKESVDPRILGKRGKLTREEHAQVRTHPTAGYYSLIKAGLSIADIDAKLAMNLTLGHHICPMVINARLSNRATSIAVFDSFFDNYSVTLPGNRVVRVASYPRTVYQHSCRQYEIVVYNPFLRKEDSVIMSEASMNWAGNVGRLVDGVTAVSEGRPYLPPRSLAEIFDMYSEEIDAGLYGEDRHLMTNILEAMLDRAAISKVIPLREEILNEGILRSVGSRSRMAAA